MSAHDDAAVLIPRYRDGGDWLVCIRRAEHLRSHGGEIAFPGGRYEPEIDADLKATALREAHEEIGLHPADVSIAGELSRIDARYGDARITPYIADIPADYTFSKNHEVSAIMHLNESHLRVQHPSDDYRYSTGFPDDLWGLSGRVLAAYLDS